MTAAKKLLLITSLVLLCACTQGNIAGQYFGIIPLPDGSKMEIELTLNPDYTFSIQTIYQENLAASFKDSGTYGIADKKYVTLRYPGDSIKFLKKDEDGSLNILTVDGKEIKGPLKNAFKLRKKTNLLF